MLEITVYTTPGCMGCWATEQQLGSTLFEAVDLSLDDAAVAEVTALGYRSAPVVVVRKNGEVVEHWNGFNPDRIARWKRAVTGILIPVAA